MHEQVGELKVDEEGLALRGVLVRHLVMPGLLDDTREIMRWIATALSCDTFVNVMDQYYPAYKAQTEPRFAQINRRLQNQHCAVRSGCRGCADANRKKGASARVDLKSRDHC